MDDEEKKEELKLRRKTEKDIQKIKDIQENSKLPIYKYDILQSMHIYEQLIYFIYKYFNSTFVKRYNKANIISKKNGYMSLNSPNTENILYIKSQKYPNGKVKFYTELSQR